MFFRFFFHCSPTAQNSPEASEMLGISTKEAIIRFYLSFMGPYLIALCTIFSGHPSLPPLQLPPQIREQMSGPDLHVFTLKFLALKNWGFFHFFGVKKNLKHFFIKKGIMQLFFADATQCFQKKKDFS